jgi:hypothetical protein
MAMKRAWSGFACVLAVAAAPAWAQAEPRSGVGPCRQGALALVAMIDQGDESSADYRNAYAGVVQTCGQPPRPAVVAADRNVCRALVLNILDTIEDGGLRSRRFAQARDAFAASCAPLER